VQGPTSASPRPTTVATDEPAATRPRSLPLASQQNLALGIAQEALRQSPSRDRRRLGNGRRLDAHMAKPRDIAAALTRHLQGACLVESTIGGDISALRFSNHLFVVAQRLRTSHSDQIRAALSHIGTTVYDGIEPDEVAVGVAVGRNAGRVVEAVHVHADGTLVLEFEGRWTIEATTDTDIVDWQWSCGPSSASPYVTQTVAHFLRELQAGPLLEQHPASQATLEEATPYYIDESNLSEASQAVGDILFLYQDAVESYGGFGHNLETGSFNAFDYARAVLAPKPGYSLGLDVSLLHEGAAVALLCELSDHIDDTESAPGQFGRTLEIRRSLERGLLDSTPLAKAVAEHAFAGHFDEFQSGLTRVYQEYVLGHFRRLVQDERH